MGISLRMTVLATGCILAFGTVTATAQEPPVYYYFAPGNYATTQGTVYIPAAGYYYNVPRYGAPAPVNLNPAQWATYPYSSFYYRPTPSYGDSVGANVLRTGRMTGSGYGRGWLTVAPRSGAYPEGGVGAPAQGFTYSNSRSYYPFYYTRGGASTERSVEANARGSRYETSVQGSAHVSGDEEDDPDW